MGGPIVSGETIAGVVVEPRAVKANSLGALLHYWRADSPYFAKVGERSLWLTHHSADAVVRLQRSGFRRVDYH